MAKVKREVEREETPSVALSPLSRAMRSEWTVVFAALLLLTVACYFMWQEYGSRVLGHPTYALTRDNIACSTMPPWIRHDIVDEVLQHNDIPLDLHDPKLTPALYAAFHRNPWVYDVKFVGKESPARVRVELQFRKPAAWVHVWYADQTGRQIPGVQPVDEYGVWLPPEDLRDEKLDRYARIAVGETSPSGPAGTPWGDVRVHQAAKLAARLRDVWHDLELYQIEPTKEAVGDKMEFDIVTKGRGILIHWGHAPGEEALGEPPAENKIAYLSEAIHIHRADSGGIGFHVIDLRRLPTNWSQTASRTEDAEIKTH